MSKRRAMEQRSVPLTDERPINRRLRAVMAVCGGQGSPPPRVWQKRAQAWGLWQESESDWRRHQGLEPDPTRCGLRKARTPQLGRANFSAPASALKSLLMSTSIVRLENGIEPEVSAPPEDRLIAGNPEHRVWNFFTDSTQQFFAGRWAATRGKWRVRYTENELCVMTAGRVVIESTSGERDTFGPGDAFVIPAGFEGTWEVIEDCSKIYAIFQAQG